MTHKIERTQYPKLKAIMCRWHVLTGASESRLNLISLLIEWESGMKFLSQFIWIDLTKVNTNYFRYSSEKLSALQPAILIRPYAISQKLI